MTTPVVNISPNNPVFDLPIYVARDEGLFQRAGIDVRFQAKYSERRLSDTDPFQRLKEALFEQGKADVYNLCEWAGIDRSQKSPSARIPSPRPIRADAVRTLRGCHQPRSLRWHRPRNEPHGKKTRGPDRHGVLLGEAALSPRRP